MITESIQPDFIVWADGGNRNNADPERWDAYGSFLVKGDAFADGVIRRFELGPRSNNEAEYLAFINALSYLLPICAPNAKDYSVRVFTDSKLMREQILGNWKVKAEHLQWYKDKALRLTSLFKTVEVVLVPRDQMVGRLGH